MSNLISSLKIISALTAGTAVVGGGVGAFVFYGKNNQTQKILTPGTNKTSTHPTIYVVAETLPTNDQESTEINTESKNRNYECQLGSNTSTKDISCEVEAINISSNKNILSIDEITQLKGSTVNNTLLKTEGNYFKIKVSDSFYQSVISDSGSNDIQVLLTNNSSGKKFAQLKPVVFFKESLINAKTLYSVGKVSSFAKSNITYNAKNEITINNSDSSIDCIFTKDNNGTDEKTKCTINKIIENNLDNNIDFSNLKFIGKEEVQNNIKKDNYYIFKFDAQSKKESTKFKTTATTNVKVKSNDVDTLNISELIPSVILGKDSSLKLLLLGNINKKSVN